ncbi:MAG: hypothetical protein LBU77_04220 [Clostridiales bacterium]|jgi:membrane-associated HD superfamily phosphohydrolase|nr:hypothetical protein [Clostridiales bacterium]
MKNRFLCLLLLFLAFVITTGVVLTGAFLNERYDLRVGSIAPRQFKAPKEVVDEIATERARVAAVATVVNMFKSDPEIEAKIIIKLDNFFNELADLRAENMPIYDPYTEQENFPVTINGEEDYSGFSIRLTDGQFLLLSELDSEAYNEFREMVYSITAYIIETGIKEESLPKNLVSTKDEFDKLNWDTQKKDAGYTVVASVLEPTQFIDEEATEKAKTEKAAEVTPVVYLAGQKIVDVSEPITPEIYAVLDSLGYTDRSLADNYIPILGAVFTILVLSALPGCIFFILTETWWIIEKRRCCFSRFTVFVS